MEAQTLIQDWPFEKGHHVTNAIVLCCTVRVTTSQDVCALPEGHSFETLDVRLDEFVCQHLSHSFNGLQPLSGSAAATHGIEQPKVEYRDLTLVEFDEAKRDLDFLKQFVPDGILLRRLSHA